MLWYQIFSLKDTESMNFKRKACSAVLLELRKACSNLELYWLLTRHLFSRGRKSRCGHVGHTALALQMLHTWWTEQRSFKVADSLSGQRMLRRHLGNKLEAIKKNRSGCFLWLFTGTPLRCRMYNSGPFATRSSDSVGSSRMLVQRSSNSNSQKLLKISKLAEVWRASEFGDWETACMWYTLSSPKASLGSRSSSALAAFILQFALVHNLSIQTIFLPPTKSVPFDRTGCRLNVCNTYKTSLERVTPSVQANAGN